MEKELFELKQKITDEKNKDKKEHIFDNSLKTLEEKIKLIEQKLFCCDI